MAADWTAPDEWQCLQFITVASTHGAEEAAKVLSEQHPTQCRSGSFRRQSVEKTINKIETWAGKKLLERVDRKLYLTDAGREFLTAAKAVVAQYKVMRGLDVLDVPGGLPRLACLPHHTQFVARAEAALLAAPPAGQDKISVEYLDQRQRGDDQFYRSVLGQLREDVYHLLIGPEVKDSVFDSILLYEAQLEVMVPATHQGSAMSVADLIQNHRAFIQPSDMQPRRLLEDRIRRWGIPDPHSSTRIVGETYEIAATVMRIRSEAGRSTQESRVVVVPSDAALAFKPGREFGGLNADKFKWMPLYHRDSSTQDVHRLTMPVFVTTKRDDTKRDSAMRDQLSEIIKALKQAVAQLPREGSSQEGASGLGGEPLEPPAPRQRKHQGSAQASIR
ncbi:MAG TPA: hypothetical protein VJT31_28550 [Rugosimonospora sp.]|nr:hypothetical protein [Rugosimonospora sp.]